MRSRQLGRLAAQTDDDGSQQGPGRQPNPGPKQGTAEPADPCPRRRQASQHDLGDHHDVIGPNQDGRHEQSTKTTGPWLAHVAVPSPAWCESPDIADHGLASLPRAKPGSHLTLDFCDTLMTLPTPVLRPHYAGS
jgi:hypothetical protein